MFHVDPVQKLVDGALHAVTAGARRLPHARRRLIDMEVYRDLAYGPDPAQKLDVYRSARTPANAPVLLYLHGGGFSVCSKETHWGLAVKYARMGFVVFNANYRLAPPHPYPAAFDDAVAAVEYAQAHSQRYDGNPDKLVIAGESAGGNLVTALACASAYESRLPSAARLYASGTRFRGVVAACGVIQVSNMARLKHANQKIADEVLWRMERAYLGRLGVTPGAYEFADPLLMLEGRTPNRPLPPFQVFVGTDDVLYQDSIRLSTALRKQRVDLTYDEYPSEGHAFHAATWKHSSKACWQCQRQFLTRVSA